MKRTFIFIMMVLVVSMMVACSKNNRTVIDTSVNSGKDEKDLSRQRKDQSQFQTKPVMEAVSQEKVREAIEKTDNLLINEDYQFFMPEKCDSVFTFDRYYNWTEDGSKYLGDFVSAVKEVFPDEKYDEKKLMFVGERFFNTLNNTESQNELPAYSDYKNEVDSGSENVKYFIYQDTSADNPVFVESTGYLGSNLFRFNRAKLLSLKNSLTGEEMPSFLEVSLPNMYSDYVESFRPDSEESFKLMDSEMKICDAVKFFEDYLNNLSFLASEDVKTKVVRVDLYKFTYDPKEYENRLSDEKYETYFYLMNYSFEYKGLLFSYAEIADGAMFTKSYGQPVNAIGAMVRTDEVEFVYELQHCIWAKDVEEYDKIVSVEDAIKECSEKLTPNVRYSVLDIGLFYQQDEMSFVDKEKPETGYHYVYPIWRFTLFNQNDERYYRVFFDALTGDFLAIQGM